MNKKRISCKLSNAGSRNEVRKRVINKFLRENPGKGTGNDATRYDYHVETLSDGKRIVMSRPARLRFGFDFLIKVEDFDFNKGKGRKRNSPNFEDFFDDLKRKKRRNRKVFNRLIKQIRRVHGCNEIKNADIQRIKFSIGFPVDMILYCLKWLFIEQDIRYWNYSGRDKLMGAIEEI